jgi:hypothetical protein
MTILKSELGCDLTLGRIVSHNKKVIKTDKPYARPLQEWPLLLYFWTLFSKMEILPRERGGNFGVGFDVKGE